MFQELNKYKKLVLGFSGGADSTALALFLIDRQILFEAVHFHHHLRTDSADNDAAFCQKFCGEYKIPFTLIDIPVNELKENSESIESAARRLRMEYWEKNFSGADSAVLLAHHKDDVIENLFIRSLRGSSSSGLSGLRAQKSINAVTYLRPLLDMPKKEILKFLEKKNVNWCEDESNKEDIYTRNIIRNKIIPQLEEIAPIQGLYRTAENVKTDALFIEEQAENWLKENALNCETYLSLHPALKARVIRLFIQQNCGVDFIPGHDAIQRINDETAKVHNEDALVPLGEGIEIIVASSGEIYLESKEFTYEWNWQKESSIETPDGKIYISDQKTESSEEFKKSDLEKTLKIRNWKAGDRMVPFSRKSETKVKDLFSDRKIAHSLRKKLPLIISNQLIIWIPEVKRAEFGRCNSSDETVIIAYERF